MGLAGCFPVPSLNETGGLRQWWRRRNPHDGQTGCAILLGHCGDLHKNKRIPASENRNGIQSKMESLGDLSRDREEMLEGSDEPIDDGLQTGNRSFSIPFKTATKSAIFTGLVR